MDLKLSLKCARNARASSMPDCACPIVHFTLNPFRLNPKTHNFQVPFSHIAPRSDGVAHDVNHDLFALRRER